jgi:hypothetical protein
MKRRLFSTTVLALTALSTGLSACAESPARPFAPPSSSSRIGSLMQIAIVDRTSGAELPIYRHRGEYWVAGRPGARYAIRARNAMGERIMAVMSVDGVNVVSGETAGIGQTGYVFGARENSDITGWRKSDSQIAAFEFASAGNSYASRTGRPDDVGVIGVALFRENVPMPPSPPPPPPIAPYQSRDEYSPRDRELRSESSAMGDARAKSAPAEAAASAEAPRRHLDVRDAGFLERLAPWPEAQAPVEAFGGALRMQHHLTVAARRPPHRPARAAPACTKRRRAAPRAPPCGPPGHARRGVQQAAGGDGLAQRLTATACTAVASASSHSSRPGCAAPARTRACAARRRPLPSGPSRRCAPWRRPRRLRSR